MSDRTLLEKFQELKARGAATLDINSVITLTREHEAKRRKGFTAGRVEGIKFDPAQPTMRTAVHSNNDRLTIRATMKTIVSIKIDEQSNLYVLNRASEIPIELYEGDVLSIFRTNKDADS